MRTNLILPGDISEAILAHTVNCEPEECCGLIAVDGDGRMRFAYPLTNTDRSPSSFTVDPDESYRAFLHAEAMGWEISGVFHSHPNGPNALSDRDVAEAPEGWTHLLACPSGLKAFRITKGIVDELEVSAIQIAAGILVRDGKALMCHRLATREFYQDVWDLPGGHVDLGESPAIAMAREIQEELSVTVPPPLPPVWKTLRVRNVEFSLFIITSWKGEPSNSAPQEHDQIRWVDQEELAELRLAHDDYRRLLPQAIAATSEG